MKRFGVAGAVTLVLCGLWALLPMPGARTAGQKGPDKAPAAEPKPAEDPADQADRSEAEGDYDLALKHYLEAEKTRPKDATLQFKIAACQAAVEKKEEAVKTLRKVLEMKSASADLVSRARAALQELLLPKLSETRQKQWKEAQALIQSGEELKRHEDEDLEIRIEHKLFAGPFRKAIELLDKLTEDVPDYAPAHLSLGIAHENLSNFKQAADGYRAFLTWGSKNKLPELDQQSQIRQRLLICERRYEVDVGLEKRVPGIWVVSYDYDHGERTRTTATTGEGGKVTDSTTTSFVHQSDPIKLLPGGRAARPVDPKAEIDKLTWKAVDSDTEWKVVGKRLIVRGLLGRPTEWCNLGQLNPAGDRFEGLTMQLHRTRWVKVRSLEEKN